MSGATFTSTRRVNFTHGERVEKHNVALTGRNYDVANSKKKAEVWREIAHEFNDRCQEGNARDVRQLRKCWENMKSRFRKNNKPVAVQPTVLQGGGQSASKLAYADLGSTTPTSQLTERLAPFVDSQGEAISSSSLPRFVDSILNTLENSLDTDPAQQQVVKEELSPTPSVEFVGQDGAQTEDPSCKTLQINSVVSVSQPGTSGSGTASITRRIPFPSAAPSIGSGHRFNTDPERKQRRLVITKRLHKQPFTRRLRPNERLNPPTNSQGPETTMQTPGPQSRLSWPGDRKRLQSRPNQVDGEKALRMRLLRARIREHEVRTRAMQQKMRHSMERHEAILMLLRRRTAHCEAQLVRMRAAEQDGDDAELEDEDEEDLMWDILD